MTARILAALLLASACAVEAPPSPAPGPGIVAPAHRDDAEAECHAECDAELDACLEHEQGSSAACGLSCAQRCEAFYATCEADC